MSAPASLSLCAEHKGNKARIEADLAEVKETLGQMKMEIHSVSGKAAKDAYNEKIAKFKTRVAAAEKSLLFSGSAGAAAASGGAVPGSLAARAQTQEEKHAASMKLLKQSAAQLHETEIVGQNTVENLAKQGEQIRNTQDKTNEINSNLSRSNQLLNKMSQWWRG